jgi:ankyrin repeat protein
MQKPETSGTQAPTLGELREVLDWDRLIQFEVARRDEYAVDYARLIEEVKHQPIIARATWNAGETLLHVAASQGQRELAALLLELGADVNAYCPEGIPLHYAAHSGSHEMAELLVEAGSELNRQECRGRTAVDIASSPAHNWAAVKYLISVGAVPNQESTLENIRVMRESGLWDELSIRPVTFAPQWRTDAAVALARQMYESHDFGAMPILADALQDAGCDNADILDHCRSPGPHVRGCWVVDLVLGKE